MIAVDYAALSEELVERLPDLVRRECLAVGLSGALHSHIDLGTEPRRGRQRDVSA
ncbi:hypothetical protein ACF09E_32860 [Streptomyces sp. NPDC014891]|uniref:hypothetical protein n=1 Tax=Streptomyces sp. NPDC014891 TaxID=3364929 RepID=UPI0037034A6A